MIVTNNVYDNDDYYERVVEEVYPHLEKQERGLLYRAIQIIHGEEKSQTPENTQDICKSLDINANADKKDDVKKAKQFLIGRLEKYYLDNKDKNLFQKIGNFLEDREKTTSKKIQAGDDKMIEIRLIIIGACTLVGFIVCRDYLDKERKKSERKKVISQERKEQPSPPPIPASLCLVVPARIASTLEINSRLLSVNSVKYLIDNTAYFLCTTCKVADSNEQEYLKIAKEKEILPNSQRDVYIRIDINSGGKNLIDKKNRLALKNNLPENAEFALKEVARLKDLSGLEKFIRI